MFSNLHQITIIVQTKCNFSFSFGIIRKYHGNSSFIVRKLIETTESKKGFLLLQTTVNYNYYDLWFFEK